MVAPPVHHPHELAAELSGPPGWDLLPTAEPLQLVDPAGDQVGSQLALPPDAVLLDLHRAMVLGRRFDAQVTALTRQGRLAVYPSSRGQEACQVTAATVLRPQDWLFPTYRDTVAVLTRGVDPAQALVMFRGDRHCGYDPHAHRVAPQCTPLATNTLHAVGLAHGARLQGGDTVALVLLGDGATSEGDTAEALTCAGVWRAPVVFLVQNNGYAISVPLAKQTAAPSLALKGVGHGVPGVLVDGNDAAALHAVLTAAVARAAAGGGPTLVEARTYRMEAHTNADDATRYRSAEEVAAWRGRDPVDRLAHLLTARGLLDDRAQRALAAEAEQLAARIRDAMTRDPDLDPLALFDHVYAEPPAHLRAQRRELAEELATAEEPAAPDGEVR